MSDAAFRDVRRTLELSPLTIARLHGRSPARVEALSVAALRERARTGVAGHAITARQARILLRRQVTQLPRWLGQARYNGPPKTHRGLLVALPQPLRDQPVGLRRRHARRLRAVPPEAAGGPAPGRDRRRLARPAQRARHAGQPPGGPPRPNQPLDPRSAYNATVSGDGRLVAYESSPGNVNFAKRYGRIGVELADATRGRSSRIDHPPRGEDLSQSAYNPQLAADGRHLAYQAVRAAGTAQVFVCDLHTGARTLASGGLPRAPRGGDLDLRAAHHDQRALRGLHRGDQSRDGRAGRDLVARHAARPRPAHDDDDQRRPGGLRLRSHRLGRRAARRLHGRSADAAPLPARRGRGHDEGAHHAGRRRRGRSAALRRRPRARLHGRARRAQPRRGTPARQRRHRAGRQREGLGDRPVAVGRRRRPGLHLRRTRPQPGQDRPQPRRLRARPARRHDDARQRAHEAGPAKPPLPTSTAPTALAPVAGGTLAAPRISILDNAFVRGHEGPTLRISPRDGRHLALAQPVLAQ